jgi:hypothetical protein
MVKPATKPTPQIPIDLQEEQFKKEMAKVPIKGNAYDYMLECVLAMAPELSANIKRLALIQTAKHFGKDYNYLPAYCRDIEHRDAEMKMYFDKGAQINWLSRHYELSRTRVYEIVTGKKR